MFRLFLGQCQPIWAQKWLLSKFSPLHLKLPQLKENWWVTGRGSMTSNTHSVPAGPAHPGAEREDLSALWTLGSGSGAETPDQIDLDPGSSS